jgi:NTE family protein
MTFGDHWVFEKTGMGDAEAGYVLPGPPRLVAQAVAASACFPPVFGPVSLHLDPDTVTQGTYAKSDRGHLLRNLHLTDGGVVDNLGVERVWEHAGDLLVSDGGATFQFGWRPDIVWRLLRYTSIADSRGTIVRKRWLIANLTTGLMRGAYWGIGSAAVDYEPTGPAGDPANVYDRKLVQERICSVRTDLDAFTAAEMAVLENHGYVMAEAATHQYATHLMTSPHAPFAVPNPAWMDSRKVDRALCDSNKRTLLGRRFLSP